MQRLIVFSLFCHDNFELQDLLSSAVFPICSFGYASAISPGVLPRTTLYVPKSLFGHRTKTRGAQVMMYTYGPLGWLENSFMTCPWQRSLTFPRMVLAFSAYSRVVTRPLYTDRTPVSYNYRSSKAARQFSAPLGKKASLMCDQSQSPRPVQG